MHEGAKPDGKIEGGSGGAMQDASRGGGRHRYSSRAGAPPDARWASTSGGAGCMLQPAHVRRGLACTVTE